MGVLDILQSFSAISRSMYDALKYNQDQEPLIDAGIHAILPVKLHREGYKWNCVIYLFYWPMENSFDMERMKAVKYMRKDPSCLLSRVLFEISSTVCIQVSSSELTDFGVTYDPTQRDDDQKTAEVPKGSRR